MTKQNYFFEKNKSGDDGLHDWFNKSKSSDGKKGWVQLGGRWAGKPCARQPGQTSTPKCGSSKMSANLSPEEEERARRRKNRLDPNQPEKSEAEKPTYVRTEQMELQEVKDKPGKGSGKKDACYNKVKSRYSVWPSAYASGALVKCRKVGASNWGTKSEEIMHEEERYCPMCDKREKRSECSYGEKVWDKVSVKDEEYSMARSELNTIIDAVRRLKTKVDNGEGNLEAWVQSKITKAADYIDTAADYLESGEHEFNEETIEDLNGNSFAEVVDLINPEKISGFKSQIKEASRIQSQTGNVVAVTLLWKGKYYSLKIFFPQLKIPTRKEINDELQKVYPGSNVVYHSISEIQPGKPFIQISGPQGGSYAKPGPNKNYVKPMGEGVEVNEEGPSLSVGRGEKLPVSRGGGLTEKGRKKYNRATGSNLQAPVTGDVKPGSKAAKRREQFCSRSINWKGERGLAARRRWKC